MRKARVTKHSWIASFLLVIKNFTSKVQSNSATQFEASFLSFHVKPT
jgi:hypothetical protein